MSLDSSDKRALTVSPFDVFLPFSPLTDPLTSDSKPEKQPRLVDIKSLSIYIKLVEMKMVYVNNLNLILTNDVFNLEERAADIGFITRNVQTIDRYLKNIMLKLRLRFDKNVGSLIRR